MYYLLFDDHANDYLITNISSLTSNSILNITALSITANTSIPNSWQNSN